MSGDELLDGRVRLLAGSSNRVLAERVAGALELPLSRAHTGRFPDGEASVGVDPDLRGTHVYLLQPTGPPADAHLVELLLLADAARRCGAISVVAVIPYVAYARQDRRTDPGQPIGVRVVGDMLAGVGIDRVIAVDPHTRALEAIFSVPVEAVTAVPVLADALDRSVGGEPVVVAPDLGAVKLAERYAGLLDAPVALVRKTRVSGEQVRTDGIVGTVRGRQPVIVDDMISTGGTVVAAAEALAEAGNPHPVTVVATHGLLVGDAGDRLGEIRLERLIVADTVPLPDELSVQVDVASTGSLLADVIHRLEAGRRLDDLEDFG